MLFRKGFLPSMVGFLLGEGPARDDDMLRKVDDAPICIQVTPQAS